MLLCCLCHRKHHAGIITLPTDYHHFDSAYCKTPITPVSLCPVCNTLKSTNKTACSLKCAGKLRQKIDWDAAEAYYLQCRKFVEVARQFGCSDNAVKKQMIKRGVVQSK